MPVYTQCEVYKGFFFPSSPVSEKTKGFDFGNSRSKTRSKHPALILMAKLSDLLFKFQTEWRPVQLSLRIHFDSFHTV